MASTNYAYVYIKKKNIFKMLPKWNNFSSNLRQNVLKKSVIALLLFDK